MKTLYANLIVLDISCDGKDNTKDKCSCISIVVPSKTGQLARKKRKQHEWYCRDFYNSLLAFSFETRKLK